MGGEYTHISDHKSYITIALDKYGYPPVGNPTVVNTDRQFINLNIDNYLILTLIIITNELSKKMWLVIRACVQKDTGRSRTASKESTKFVQNHLLEDDCHDRLLRSCPICMDNCKGNIFKNPFEEIGTKKL